MNLSISVINRRDVELDAVEVEVSMSDDSGNQSENRRQHRRQHDDGGQHVAHPDPCRAVEVIGEREVLRPEPRPVPSGGR